jgi:hypothetical protein
MVQQAARSRRNAAVERSISGSPICLLRTERDWQRTGGSKTRRRPLASVGEPLSTQAPRERGCQGEHCQCAGENAQHDLSAVGIVGMVAVVSHAASLLRGPVSAKDLQFPPIVEMPSGREPAGSQEATLACRSLRFGFPCLKLGSHFLKQADNRMALSRNSVCTEQHLHNPSTTDKGLKNVDS